MLLLFFQTSISLPMYPVATHVFAVILSDNKYSTLEFHTICQKTIDNYTKNLTIVIHPVFYKTALILTFFAFL